MKRLALLSLSAVVILTARAKADPVAMACHVTGKVEVRTAAGAWQPLRVLQRLEPGTAVRTGAGGDAVLVVFSSGERFRVPPGPPATVEAQTVRGGRTLGALSGPSAAVARTLGGSRVGAVMARDVSTFERLTPTTPGWMPLDQRHYEWTPIRDAATYSFSFFDSRDNVVWSARVATASADYPADLPPLLPRQPYTWRLVPFGESGKALPQTRWGVLTFLSAVDSAALAEAEASLKLQAGQSPNDATPHSLLVELYRGYGVYENALETLDRLKERGEPGVPEALDEAYREIGPAAVRFGGVVPRVGE